MEDVRKQRGIKLVTTEKKKRTFTVGTKFL